MRFQSQNFVFFVREAFIELPARAVRPRLLSPNELKPADESPATVIKRNNLPSSPSSVVEINFVIFAFEAITEFIS